MEKFRPCPNPLRGCPETPPFEDSHHIYWPACDYNSALERKFRNLPDHVTRICRCLHNLEHLKKPPVKPHKDDMRKAVDEHFANN